MGMAASQARYLALVARKSNCEFEGQQINQARTALSNQSANLFNQMLGLKVPVPPSTQDFTKTQYSYTDGVNNSVIDSWKQLSAADPDYNYIVKTHYYTDVYTGSVKKMSDPQVQISDPGNPIATIHQINVAVERMNKDEEEMNARYSYWQSVKTQNERKIADLKKQAQTDNRKTIYDQGIEFADWNEITQDVFGYYQLSDYVDNKSYKAYVYKDPNKLPTGVPTDFNNKIWAEQTLGMVKDLVDLGILNIQDLNKALMDHDPSAQLITDISELTYDGSTFTGKQIGVLNTFALVNVDGTADCYISLVDQVDSLVGNVSQTAKGAISGYPELDPTTHPEYKSNGSYLYDIDELQKEIESYEQAYNIAKVTYETSKMEYEALNRPIYVGNSELTYLDKLTDDQKTELEQVVKDLKEQGISEAIAECFNEKGEYLGGIYSFKLNGNVYYTTWYDLCDAYDTYTVAVDNNNLIDSQYKMPYYNASYVSKKIEQERKALLETDGNGRFTSVRFADDSITYTLNVETITDDKAYEDAMNKYNYENSLYDKTIQDINAKTSIIQHEDQQLELRLKQLDTEQKALSTEIDAVSKIVKDNIDSSFKTFSS